MAQPDETKNNNDSLGDDEPKKRLGSDPDRVRLVREIGELSHIPEIKTYIANAAAKAKLKYQKEIDKYMSLKQRLEKELGEKNNKDDSRRKSYYFEMTKVPDPETDVGHRWELGKFKLEPYESVVDMIFSRFAANIDDYPISPSQVQSESIYSALMDKWFKIDFTKSSDDRVVGFVKIIEENFVRKETDTMLTVNTRTERSLQKEKVIRLMEENPGFFEDINFYASVISQANGTSTI